MCKTIFRAFLGDHRLPAVFIRVFVAVFAAGLVCSAIVAYSTRPIYISIARLEVIVDVDGTRDGRDNQHWYPQSLDSQCKIISSFDFSEQVTTNLNLQQALASQAGEPDWPVQKAAWELKQKVSVTQMPGTNVIAISVQNADPNLAANIANALAGVYREYCLLRWNQEKSIELHSASPVPDKQMTAQATILNLAGPNLSSVVRSKSEIFSTWALGGTLLALVAGGAGALRAFQIRRLPDGNGTPP
jgi:capsular polysaccharide biosynthesis protein